MTGIGETVRAADHLVDLLKAHGTTHVFGVPGESYLPVLDALHGREEEVQFVTFRQEGGAAMAADAHGKLTGRPGICMVTRGPGASNASAGLHIAFQDSTPMILFIGQVARNMVEREAFQEVDYRRMFGQMAKWVAEIDDPSRMQEYISRAYRTALSGRPGPVVLSLPEDMLYEQIKAPATPTIASTPRYQPAPETLNALREQLAAAERPLVIAGGGGWTKKGMDALAKFAQVQNLPIAVSLRSQGLMDNNHPNYVGHFGVGLTPYLDDALDASDLLIVIGARLGEMTTVGYSLIEPPVPSVPLIHVFPAPEELGRVYEPEIAIASDTESFCSVVSNWDKLTAANIGETTAMLRSSYEHFNSPASVPDDPLAPFFAHLLDALPQDAIMCNGAGNYASWLHRFYRYRSHGSQLAPTSGSMGYGVPAAVSAAITAPERPIVAIAGDGCFMMTCQELATAVHHNVTMTVIVINNNRYGTIRAHQEREYPGRVSGTGLTNPDFCALAKSFGFYASRADDLETFKVAVSNIQSRGGLNLLEIQVDPAIVSPGKRLENF